MRFSSILAGGCLAGSAYSAAAAAPVKGFNIAAQTPTGSCKTEAQWELNFNAMKNLPGNFRYVRVYASSDCGTLANAVPAALNTGIKLLVGVWTEDANHYAAEKAALQAAIQQHGTSWIQAVSVGSEDLYRGDTTAAALAGQMNEVRGIVRSMGGTNIPVGHVDTWTAWVNSTNVAILKATDFVGFDGYPYYQNVTIDQAKATFDKSIQATKNAIAANKPGTPLWITETGWPVAGPNSGAAVPSVANAQAYWRNVWCAYPNAVAFHYTLRDYYAAPKIPSFGVLDVNFNPIYNLACP